MDTTVDCVNKNCRWRCLRGHMGTRASHQAQREMEIILCRCYWAQLIEGAASGSPFWDDHPPG